MDTWFAHVYNSRFASLDWSRGGDVTHINGTNNEAPKHSNSYLNDAIDLKFFSTSLPVSIHNKGKDDQCIHVTFVLFVLVFTVV